MDPLVSGALTLQRALTFGLGTVIGVAATVVVGWAPSAFGHGRVMLALMGLVLVSMGVRFHRRFRRIDPLKSSRREVEIAVHLVPLVYFGLEHLPGGLTGPYHAVVYAMTMVIAAYFATPAMVAAVGCAAFLELSLGARHQVSLVSSAVHVGSLLLFSWLNWALFRGEIRRVRSLSKQHLESELLKLKEAARDYRLTGVPRSAADGAAQKVSAPQGDEERLLQSSLDHLHGSLSVVLDLLRRSLGLRTAALLWLHDEGRRLSVREVSSDVEELMTGPFATTDGLLAAALNSRDVVSLDARRGQGRMPLYDKRMVCGVLTAVAVEQHGQAVGVLLVESDLAATAPAEIEDMLRRVASFVVRAVENERLFLSLQRAKVEQGKLYQAADMLAEARSEVSVIRAGVESARQFARFDFAAVTLFRASSRRHEICAVSGEGAEQLVGATFDDNAGLVSMVVKNQHPLPYRGEYQAGRQTVFSSELEIAPMPSLIIIPLRFHEVAMGTLVLGSNTKGAFGEHVRPTLEVLARHVAVSLANARMVKRLEDLATTDGMTGLLNKRALTDVARQKIRSAQRFSKSLSVIVGDIDHFKRVNDQYGHDIGDVVIKGFADVLRRSKRETDAVGRFGGEEFVVVCEETDAEGARLLAERVRSELAAVTFHTPSGPLQVTCSLGVATLPGAGTDWETLFKSTDEALYVSKRGGRDQVTVWAPKMRGAAA